jgi:hypothetical protein
LGSPVSKAALSVLGNRSGLLLLLLLRRPRYAVMGGDGIAVEGLGGSLVAAVTASVRLGLAGLLRNV